MFLNGGDSLINPDNDLLHYVEEFGLFYEQYGVPRTAGRILGWLMICDPPHQTMDDLVEVLQVSKSSVSTATRTLMQGRVIDKVSLPGYRPDFYRVNKDTWIRNWEMRSEGIAAIRQLIERGLELLDDEEPERRLRLEEMYDFFLFIEKEFPAMIDRYRAQRKDQTTDKS